MNHLRVFVYKVTTLIFLAATAGMFLFAWLIAHNLTPVKDYPMSFSESVYWCVIGVMLAGCGGFSMLLANGLELKERIRSLETRRGECEDDSHPRTVGTE